MSMINRNQREGFACWQRGESGKLHDKAFEEILRQIPVVMEEDVTAIGERPGLRWGIQ
jgi:hypothetical protein